MALKVVKDFNSTTQRFRKGDEIADGADLSPHTADSLKSAGYVAEPPAPKAAAAAPAATDNSKA